MIHTKQSVSWLHLPTYVHLFQNTETSLSTSMRPAADTTGSSGNQYKYQNAVLVKIGRHGLCTIIA